MCSLTQLTVRKTALSDETLAPLARGISRLHLDGGLFLAIVTRQRAIQLGTFYDRSTRCLSLRHNLFERNRGTCDTAAVPPAGFDGSRLRARSLARSRLPLVGENRGGERIHKIPEIVGEISGRTLTEIHGTR